MKHVCQYEICFGVDDFALIPTVQSEVIKRVADAFQGAGILIGIPIGTANLRHVLGVSPGLLLGALVRGTPTNQSFLIQEETNQQLGEAYHGRLP